MKYFGDYSKQDQEILANEICPKASPSQINYFLRACEAKSISPFSGLMYLTLRKNMKTGETKATIAPSVDGSRLSASRSGEYAGSDEPEYDSDDNKQPKWCRVTVYRMSGNERRPYTAKCRYDEFKPSAGQDYMWNAKPYHMIAKVTEVQALRKGFPDYVYGDRDEEDIGEIITETVANTAAPTQEDVKLRERLISFQAATQHFAKLGFKEEDLLKELNIENKNQVTEEHLVHLRKMKGEHEAMRQIQKDPKGK